IIKYLRDKFNQGNIDKNKTKQNKTKKTPEDDTNGNIYHCLKEGNCKALKCSFFECKRSMLDARSRSGGRKGHLVLLC
uniref:Uncharacterized protein n=1 Tax=Ursus maritimus TaxID=29073 RepID=A0A452SZS4_URSMA